MRYFYAIIIALLGCEEQKPTHQCRVRDCSEEVRLARVLAVNEYLAEQANNAVAEAQAEGAAPEPEEPEPEFVYDITCYSGGREIFKATVSDFENDGNGVHITTEIPGDDYNILDTYVYGECVAIERKK